MRQKEACGNFFGGYSGRLLFFGYVPMQKTKLKDEFCQAKALYVELCFATAQLIFKMMIQISLFEKYRIQEH